MTYDVNKTPRINCPKCNDRMQLLWKKNGDYIGRCLNPDCKHECLMEVRVTKDEQR